MGSQHKGLRLAALGGGGALLLAACGVSPEYLDDVEEPHEVIIVKEVPAAPAPRPATPPPQRVPRPEERASILGHWEGVATQTNAPEWDVSLDITTLEPGPCATFRYPGCAGYWECRRSNGDRIHALERVTRGQGKCVDNVRIVVQLSDDGQHLYYRAVGGGAVAKATLH